MAPETVGSFLIFACALGILARVKNQPGAVCKISLRKPDSHLNKSQVSKALMQVLLSVHGSKSIHSYIEVIMSFLC